MSSLLPYLNLLASRQKSLLSLGFPWMVSPLSFFVLKSNDTGVSIAVLASQVLGPLAKTRPSDQGP